MVTTILEDQRMSIACDGYIIKQTYCLSCPVLIGYVSLFFFFLSLSLCLHVYLSHHKSTYWKATNHISQWRSLQAPPLDFLCSNRNFTIEKRGHRSIDHHHTGPATAKPIATDLLSGMNWCQRCRWTHSWDGSVWKWGVQAYGIPPKDHFNGENHDQIMDLGWSWVPSFQISPDV